MTKPFPVLSRFHTYLLSLFVGSALASACGGDAGMPGSPGSDGDGGATPGSSSGGSSSGSGGSRPDGSASSSGSSSGAGSSSSSGGSISGSGSSSGSTSSSGSSSGFVGNGTAVHAVDNQLYDGTTPIRLLGADRSGTEYRCIQGANIFDGPSDQASISAMLTWKINSIRVPLNEDCWLGVNTLANSPSSTAYQQAIVNYVGLLLQNGIYPILDLHWSAPGTTAATRQYPMPDMDHSVAFWTSVAGTFASQPKVILELFNEPYPDNTIAATAAWTCWRDGGTCQNLVLSNNGGAVSYTVAGMQTLLSAVRSAGANNFVLLGGLQFSNNLTQWLTYEPTDPQNNVGAAWHIYDSNACKTAACFATEGGAVAAKVPIVATEIGSIPPTGSNCNANGATFVTGVMGWLDSPATSGGSALPAQSYLAWSWNTNSTPHIISDYTGTAFCYGSTYQSHLLSTPH
jgi:endoglucanase